jgi:hypothetical protein
MAAVLSATIKNTINWTNTQPLGLPSTNCIDGNSIQFLLALADGSAANQAHQIYGNQYTTASTANNDLDMQTGLTESIFGSTVTVALTQLSMIWIQNTNTVSGDKLHLLCTASNPFSAWANSVTTSVAQIGPNSNLILSNFVNPWTVDSTHKTLRINVPGSNSVTYNVVLIGA